MGRGQVPAKQSGFGGRSVKSEKAPRKSWNARPRSLPYTVPSKPSETQAGVL